MPTAISRRRGNTAQIAASGTLVESEHIVDTALKTGVVVSGGKLRYQELTFDNIADFQAFADTSSLRVVEGQVANVQGYYTAGDGGGQQLYWDSSATDTPNGGTVFRPSSVSGSNPGRFKAVSWDGDVRKFGAKGDGVTDDSAAIQAAIDYAETLTRGMTVRFGAGPVDVQQYAIGTTLTVTGSRTCIEFASKRVGLKWIGSTGGDPTSPVIMLELVGGWSNAWIRGGFFDANSKADTCIHMVSGSASFIQSPIFLNFLGYGFIGGKRHAADALTTAHLNTTEIINGYWQTESTSARGVYLNQLETEPFVLHSPHFIKGATGSMKHTIYVENGVVEVEHMVSDTNTAAAANSDYSVYVGNGSVDITGWTAEEHMPLYVNQSLGRFSTLRGCLLRSCNPDIGEYAIKGESNSLIVLDGVSILTRVADVEATGVAPNVYSDGVLFANGLTFRDPYAAGVIGDVSLGGSAKADVSYRISTLKKTVRTGEVDFNDLFKVTQTAVEAHTDLDLAVAGDALRGNLGGTLYELIKYSGSGNLILGQSGFGGFTQAQAGSKLQLVTIGGTADIYVRSGTPEGEQAAPVGSICLRTDGGAGTTFYVKESGSGNTGWAAK